MSNDIDRLEMIKQAVINVNARNQEDSEKEVCFNSLREDKHSDELTVLFTEAITNDS